MSNGLVYLGVLAAQTSQGRRAVAVALTGAVELYHLVDAGFVAGSTAVEDWLLTAGINPQEAYAALPPERMLADILLPEIGGLTLVVAHSDTDVALVDQLVSTLGRQGNPPIVSGIEISGPIAGGVNGAAGRRAFALQARYEVELEKARRTPTRHVLDGSIDGDGMLVAASVDGPFAKASWTLEEEQDGLFAMMSLAGLAGFATFTVKDGPAASALSRLAGEVGLENRLAA